MTAAPPDARKVLETVARALGRIDRDGMRAITSLSVTEIEAMALTLVGFGLIAIPPGADVPARLIIIPEGDQT
ncbi:MAG: hypothetical protein ACK4GW_13560 [Pseudorhodobacter sp.]